MYKDWFKEEGGKEQRASKVEQKKELQSWKSFGGGKTRKEKHSPVAERCKQAETALVASSAETSAETQRGPRCLDSDRPGEQLRIPITRCDGQEEGKIILLCFGC